MRFAIIRKDQIPKLLKEGQEHGYLAAMKKYNRQGDIDVARLAVERARRQILMGQPVRAMGLLEKALEHLS